jgi:hypothetical protein
MTLSRGAFAMTCTAGALSGCALLANLSQFDGATNALVDGSTPRDANLGPDAASADDGPAGDVSVLDDGGDSAGATDGDADAGPVNLIQNPGFELGIIPWTTFSDGSLSPTLAASTAHYHTGSYSGFVGARTQAYEGTVQEIGQSIVQGHTYMVTAWALVDVHADAGLDAGASSSQPVYATAAINCLVDGSKVTNYTQIATALANDTGWTRLFGAFTPPACTLSSMELYVAGPAAGVDLYVDDVSLVP